MHHPRREQLWTFAAHAWRSYCISSLGGRFTPVRLDAAIEACAGAEHLDARQADDLIVLGKQERHFGRDAALSKFLITVLRRWTRRRGVRIVGIDLVVARRPWRGVERADYVGAIRTDRQRAGVAGCARSGRVGGEKDRVLESVGRRQDLLSAPLIARLIQLDLPAGGAGRKAGREIRRHIGEV